MISEMTFLPAFITNSAPQGNSCNCGSSRASAAPDDDEPLRLPVVNWSEEPEPDYTGAAIPHPPGFDPRERTEPTTSDDWRPPRPSDLFDDDGPSKSWGSPIDPPAIAQAFVTNNSTPDDEPLRLPYVNWSDNGQ